MDEGYRERMERLRELRIEYEHSHRLGMEALQNNDLAALDGAIQAETLIIKEQSIIVKELREWPTTSDT